MLLSLFASHFISFSAVLALASLSVMASVALFSAVQTDQAPVLRYAVGGVLTADLAHVSQSSAGQVAASEDYESDVPLGPEASDDSSKQLDSLQAGDLEAPHTDQPPDASSNRGRRQDNIPPPQWEAHRIQEPQSVDRLGG